MTQKQPIVAVTRATPGGDLRVEGAEMRQFGDAKPTRQELFELVEGASVIVSMFSDPVDRELIDAAGEGLRGICNFAVGFNNIDTECCKERGIVVANTPDAVTEGTANLGFMLLLACARRLVESDRFTRSGAWVDHGPLSMSDFMGLELTGRVIHIVGAGRIGYAMAQRAKAFGMDVIYTARSQKIGFEIAPLSARRAGLEEGLAMADVVSIHTPLTPETKHLLNRERIGMLKPEAIVVNTSRGPTIDEAALAEACREKRIWGAGLDVFEEEPRVHPELVRLDNVVLTPHIGSAERRWREEMSRMCEQNAAAILAGEEPPYRVV
ncbi:MAG: D-glycerate dehydrogenase [Phycisphaera sp.]|nr:MAG: D-glycerate dehydrogenase [Phycisphaera sp.]